MHIYQVGFAETSRLQADGWMKHNTTHEKCMYLSKKNNDLTATSLMLSRGNYTNVALFQIGELL